MPRSGKACIACAVALTVLPAGGARALTPTVVATYSPFAPTVRTAPGFAVVPVAGATCATASFVVAGAFRCAVRDRIHDPCYLNATPSTPPAPVVDCAASPWGPRIVRLHLTTPPVPALAATPDVPPWALQLASGRRCVRTTGATTTVRGRRLSYVCDGHRVLFGRPQATIPVWRIRQARDTGGRGARDVAIAVAWR